MQPNSQPTAKKRFFNAANNNVPLQEIAEEQQQLKFELEKSKPMSLKEISNMRI